jgi:protein phosphatase
VCAVTDVGRVRDHNEDAFHVSVDGRLLIVADGMGGHQAGEVASAIAVETLVRFFDVARQQAIAEGGHEITPMLLEAFAEADRQVREAAVADPSRCDMGTTLILAYVEDDRLQTCHVGDVRCYVRSADGLRQITRDHSVVGALVRAGELAPEDAQNHPRRNEILQAVGLGRNLLPDINCVPLAQGDRILLCSDGLWDALSAEKICTILDADQSMEAHATELVDQANAAGGHDNITVVLYEHVGTPK